MSTQRAVVHVSEGVAELRSDVPLPKLPGDNWVLVKTKAVALNPTDWKSIVYRPSPGAIVGCDYAGIVEEVGKGVTDLKVGDRIAGFAHGGDPKDHSNGTFAEHIKAKVGIHLKVADNIPFEDAATLGVGITTVGQGLYQSLGLPLPPAKVQEPTPILIYGASTATGTLAVQYAKLSHCQVIATASPHNFELLRKLGADQVFDYKDPEVGANIRKATNDKLKLVFDCISEGNAIDIAAAAISSTGGHLSTLLPVKNFPRDDVRVTFTLGYTALGEKFNEQFQANQADYEFGSKFWKLSEALFNSGKIKAHPAELRNGLEGIPQGLQDLKDGKVSAVKLVYKIE
ncbi:oxidoreductase-like protein [Cucurbitaria berberidis CBS 394.84]|uniref:Oxidoreductase-like protein n=1 Tax=Cucurbitaria berberidis CBS 394.84 TaxID=1168544 RepID=A0A9P4LC30_9PLEO|nr:oxidoreductase-like protein [Cucurbitaria berberidis CBS 394.84]KAF1850251.1 oxidoreductase-like protein [Cucurbitaria berberidis CBS 394.84]